MQKTSTVGPLRGAIEGLGASTINTKDVDDGAPGR
jgi:hypothetical protein